MRIFVTGATGFIGRPLVARLIADGHAITALSRNAERARATLGGAVEAVSPTADLDTAMARADAVVHLAGEPILGRWTASKKRAVIDSRVASARKLAEAIERATPRPGVLVTASAVGFYGDRGDERLTEESAPGSGFLTDVCVPWEGATKSVEIAGVRRVVMRLGVVLGPGGGALDKMLTPFRAGLGGRLGSGQQWVPWVHVDDVVAMFVAALTDPRWFGVVNVAAPSPVQNAELTRVLAKVLHRPAVLPVPALALKAAMGEAATMVLGSTRAEPQRALALGFAFRHPELEGALERAISGDGGG